MPLRIVIVATTWLLLMAASQPAHASFLLIGSNPTTELAVPFGEASDGPVDPSGRYQQVFDSGLFRGVFTISAITFYTQGQGGGGDWNPVTFDFSLSTTSARVGSLDPTNFDRNLGADNTLFASVSPTGTAPLAWTITGITPFYYNPGLGNLLLDIRIPNQRIDAGFFGVSFDGQADYGGSSSAVHDFGGNNPSSGLTIGLTFTTVPEPSSLAMGAVGLGLALLARRRMAA